MQASQVKDAMPQIDREVRNAAQLCQSSGNVPDELRECIGALEQETGQAASMLQQESDEKRILDCVDRMEELSDRAMQSCRQASVIDEDVRRAVQTAHGAISDLKHRLH